MTNIVIGGGITGLLVAYRLVQKGEMVTLVEKSHDLGGLLSTTKIEGVELEKFYHHIFRSDKKVIELIEELGLSDKLKWHDSSVAIYYGKEFRPFRSPVDLIKFKPISFTDRIRTGLVTLFLQKNTNWIALEKYPAYKWMKKYGGESSYKVVWEPLLKSKFGEKYKKVSMAWLWARIHLRAKSTENGKEKLGYLDGSFGQIIDKLAQNICKKGGRIMRERKVLTINNTTNGVEVDLGKEILRADRVIVCVANDQMANMIKKNKKIAKKLKKIEYTGAINVVFATKDNLTNYYWNNINEADSPFVALVKHSLLVGKYKGKHVYYLGSYINEKSPVYQKRDDQIIKIFFNYLKQICPNFNTKNISEAKLFKFDRAQHIVTCDYRTKMVDFKTGLDNVFMINFSQIFPWDRGINWAIDRVDKLLMAIDR